MFEEFWSQYPKKVAKKDAAKAWAQMPIEAQQKALEAIPTHVQYWQQTNTEKLYIPHPATWLRGERYDDEIEMPEPKQEKTIQPGWWASEAGTEAQGRQLGMSPRPGESWPQFRDRIRAKMTQEAA